MPTDLSELRRLVASWRENIEFWDRVAAAVPEHQHTPIETRCVGAAIAARQHVEDIEALLSQPAPDCTTCTADCTDRGQPHNLRSRTVEECEAARNE